MKNKHEQKVVRDAMDRLRKIARDNELRDDDGKLRFRGHPEPKDIMDELRRIYRLSRRKALAEKRNHPEIPESSGGEK